MKGRLDSLTAAKRNVSRSVLHAVILVPMALKLHASAVAPATTASFHRDIEPLLKEFCFDCHGDGAAKGKVAFDSFKSPEALLADRDLWLGVLKNTRAGLMPPEKKPRPSADAQQRLEAFIKREVFGLDPAQPDPGRVTIRRLNRIEYRNTLRDLTGFDYKVEDELPPDDTGYGFDNIGDVLTLSPMLLEKYMQAAEAVAATVPRVSRAVSEKAVAGKEFRNTSGKGTGERLSFYDAAVVTNAFTATQDGSYKLVLETEVAGQFDFDPGRARITLKVNDAPVWTNEFGWQNGKKFSFEIDQRWTPGARALALELEPLTPVEKKKNSLDLKFTALRVRGPVEPEHWGRPKNFELFFTKDPPSAPAERREYAREVLQRFVTRAYRRPPDARTVERLAGMAEEVYSQPGKRFEDGFAHAIIPVLASPKFLFRIEETESPSTPPTETAATQSQPSDKRPSPSPPERTGLKGSNLPPENHGVTASAKALPLDEYALASRLSYFLWSSMPDAELFRLAGRRELRANLPAQVRRMLADSRSQALIENFTGQWLQTRDVEGININVRAVLARDAGEEKDLERLRRDILAQQQMRLTNAVASLTPEQKAEEEKQRERRRRFFRTTIELDRDLRRALKQETEFAVAHVMREDRPVHELLDADYTFLNEKLAKHYSLTNLNITGPEMRLVKLPPDSPRGGVLTHGSVLIVTSNPTRTSPVKRGLFVLDNILGTPPPPPPADIPQLEESEKNFKDREPALREVLELHRSNALCRSCHARMDPLGLALENFNALGLWRERERGQPIDATGQLITGENFQNIREAKRILATDRRRDFHRCLTEKLLTYALGRGLEYYDVAAVDQIVAHLDAADGKFSALLMGVVESAPFQMRCSPDPLPEAPKPREQQSAAASAQPAAAVQTAKLSSIP